VSPLCSRNARPCKGLVGRAQWGTHPGHPRIMCRDASRHRGTICSRSLAVLLGAGAPLGEEAVLADSGREGEVVARAGRMRNLIFLSILLRKSRKLCLTENSAILKATLGGNSLE
jgi:hypothetical protein